jgi:hypothetical protein
MTGISLGWNCKSASFGVQNNIRKRKEAGYKTCVFDEMVSNYEGLINCIRDDFQFFLDLEYLKLIKIPADSKWLNTNGEGDTMIYNSKYKFIFNHESPGHANLYISQNWPGGLNHYIDDNFKQFINRYKKRIQNFLNYLSSEDFITFILTRYNTTVKDIDELRAVISSKYPTLKFDFVILDEDKHIMYDHLILMGVEETNEEVKRLQI